MDKDELKSIVSENNNLDKTSRRKLKSKIKKNKIKTEDQLKKEIQNEEKRTECRKIVKEYDYLSNNSKQRLISKINNDKIVIINQTTLSIAQLGQIHKEIIKKYPTAIIDDEICNSSRIRQKNIEKESLNYDLVVVIGDNHSNNTKTLFNEAKKKNSNVEMCSKVCDLKNEWFVNKNSVLVASGASVSKKNVEEIVEEIKKYKKY